MILYEYEGKVLLQQAGIVIPKSQLIHSLEDKVNLKFPIMLKAQVLSGRRADAGGIVKVENEMELIEHLEQLLGTVINQETVQSVLLEEVAIIQSEYYLSLSYDTDSRSVLLSFSENGGTGVEQHRVKTYPINILNIQSNLEAIQSDIPIELYTKITQAFLDNDCLLLEINPLVKTTENKWLALDAKIKLDDTAVSRHEAWRYSPRAVPGYSPTEREIIAKKIDQTDHRGTAGSAYFDLDGDIAIMTSGGGGSLTAMDTLIKLGGKPANYTEYSGNPPREKVEKLTEVVLSKESLHGLWVVGALANLTDIYETLSGFIDGLRNLRTQKGLKIDYPVVIRRGGPRDQEAFEMLKRVSDFDLHLYDTNTSISESAKIMLDLAHTYEQKGKK